MGRLVADARERKKERGLIERYLARLDTVKARSGGFLSDAIKAFYVSIVF